MGVDTSSLEALLRPKSVGLVWRTQRPLGVGFHSSENAYAYMPAVNYRNVGFATMTDRKRRYDCYCYYYYASARPPIDLLEVLCFAAAISFLF